MYVMYFNRSYKRTGTLWEGRFKSCLVQEETYLMQVYRYIEMNPVRASMVDEPADYFGQVTNVMRLERRVTC
jgi:putative transposase